MIDPVRTFGALNNPLRWKMMKVMADGTMLSATDAAKAFGRDIDGVIKHLRILRDAGLVSTQYGEQDRRFILYYIPQASRPQPGVLDFGFCVLYLSRRS